MGPRFTSLSTDEASMIKCLTWGTSWGYEPTTQRNEMLNVNSDRLLLDYSLGLNFISYDLWSRDVDPSESSGQEADSGPMKHGEIVVEHHEERKDPEGGDKM